MKETHLDKDLIQKIHQGASFKNEAFTLIVKQFGPLLYPKIQRITKNKEWTNDCLQNIFIKVYENIESFNGDSSLYSWLYRIAHNESLNFIQKENRRQGINLSSHNFELLAGHVQLDQLDATRIENLLFKAITLLPEKQALVFELKYFQDKQYSEISKLTGISEGGLKANYHHAVKKIEEFLIQQLNLY